MIKCEICQKEFKTQQGLIGHMRFVHGIKKSKQQSLFPPKRFVTDEALGEMFGKLILVNYAHLIEHHGMNPEDPAPMAIETMTNRKIVKVGLGAYEIVD